MVASEFWSYIRDTQHSMGGTIMSSIRQGELMKIEFYFRRPGSHKSCFSGL